MNHHITHNILKMINKKIEIADEVLGIEILSNIFSGNLYLIKKKYFKKTVDELMLEITKEFGKKYE